jgi:hypothetical protein
MTVGLEDGRLVATLFAADREAQRAFREAKRKGIAEVVTPEGALELAGLEPDLRNKLETAFGATGSEVMAMASRPGTILWTDDYALAQTAREKVGARVIWSELVFRYWKQQGRLDAATYNVACAKLIGWRYLAVPVSAETMLAAGDTASWIPDRFPLTACLDVLATDTLDTRSVVFLLLMTLPGISRSVVLPETSAQVVGAILARLQKRTDARQVVELLLGAVDRAYGVDVEGARRIHALLEEWLARRPDESLRID